MRRQNELKRRLKKGDIVIGTWSILPSASVINVIAAAGLDFIIIDMEHGPVSFETAEDMVRSAESEGCTPIIRVPKNEEDFILRALDIGAHGVVVPHIESFEEAKKAVGYAKYQPIGDRGFSPYTRAGGFSLFNVKEHCQIENEETMVILIVEGVKGINNLDSILEEKNVDIIYLGIYDLSQSIGKPGEVGHPEVKKYVEQCVRKVRDRGMACGCFAHDMSQIQRLCDIGMQFITYLVDSTVLFHAFHDSLSNFKRTFDKQ